jgi:hypothetical protein
MRRVQILSTATGMEVPTPGASSIISVIEARAVSSHREGGE